MAKCQEAKPQSRLSIREKAKEFRALLGVENDIYIDPIHILDIDLPKVDPDFNYQVLPVNEMDVHGLTYPDDKMIYIREDVYVGAVNGNGRDRFTIMHEIGHCYLHQKQNIKNFNNSFARGDKIPAYKDPEWQADVFSGEVLMDSDIIKNMSIKEIIDKCGVSFSAAKVQRSKIR